MDFLELAKERYSVRCYSRRKVEREKLRLILEAARMAPTAANYQPVHLIVVQKEEGIAKINKAANIYGASLAVIVCADEEKSWERPYDKKRSGEIDASIVTDHMMLEATQLGLGSVWICCFKPDIIKREFKLPRNLEPVNILVVGYKDDGDLVGEPYDKYRMRISQMVSYE